MSVTKNSKHTNVSLNESFSPVVLPESPAGTTLQRNLTGLPRVARDIAADIYNNIQHWNVLHIRGASVVKEMALLKSDVRQLHPAGLESLAVTLNDAVSAMNVIVDNLDTSVQQLKSLIHLHKSPVPIFLSWPVGKYSEVCERISQAYRQEYKLKYLIGENIAHVSGKDKLMLYAASWTYQPYIDSDIEMCLESLLTETGHRNKT
ncbi:uncharacterized protein CBL_20724 [Carabus blaptoides fortunei]